MKGRRYTTLDEIKTASKEELKKILKNDFLKCFEDWKNRWHIDLEKETSALRTNLEWDDHMWRILRPYDIW
ncbi:hypothetical protein LAZ67_3004444 [Cordylochernes scorpioides]|uniref:Uncharacterized protein n=1 Tax=Cordylochernes scorpioides TaxID=51811 RepID=A0ABY6KCS7_9ARAC|nr:hypothetical protein LAZ67_3004444 [Cordylochernes scorpioides]